MHRTLTAALMNAVLLIFFVSSVFPQMTEFTYQGSLTNAGSPAAGNYDFEFLLFDALNGGTQFGPALSRNGVAVANGIFSVNLDFANQFPGANRFIEIRVRPTGGGAFTPLAPRQRLASAPYSIKSMNADNAVNATQATTASTATNAISLGGIVASQYVLTGDPRMSDARNPLPGSSNYIQNQNALPQAVSNFNISGNGTAGGTLSGNIVNAATQFNIGGSRILSNAGAENLFAGFYAGALTTGSYNSFFGAASGAQNTSGSYNSFFGRTSGNSNTTGNANSFFGEASGVSNTSGAENSFFGASSGRTNVTGRYNSFFGTSSGRLNTTGDGNSLFGWASGESNTIGTANSFFGQSAGFSNTSGGGNSYFGASSGAFGTMGTGNSFFGAWSGNSNTTGSANSFFGFRSGDAITTGFENTMIGSFANVLSFGTDFQNATAIGYRAAVGASNSLVLGSISGVNGASVSTKVGIGTTTPIHRLTVGPSETPFIQNATVGIYGTGPTYSIVRDVTNDIEGLFGADPTGVIYGSMTDSFVRFRTNNIDRLVIYPTGRVGIVTLGTGGSIPLCLGNVYQDISSCGSSFRYKSNIERFSSGLAFVNKLRPISFDWKNGGMKDVGFGAEDVEEIDPRFVTYNSKGQVEGVKYDRLSVAFVNAFKEQQVMIESQQKRIERQQAEIDALKQLACAGNTSAAICRDQK